MHCIETTKRAVSNAASWILDQTKSFLLQTDALGNAIEAVIIRTGQPEVR